MIALYADGVRVPWWAYLYVTAEDFILRVGPMMIVEML